MSPIEYLTPNDKLQLMVDNDDDDNKEEVKKKFWKYEYNHVDKSVPNE